MKKKRIIYSAFAVIISFSFFISSEYRFFPFQKSVLAADNSSKKKAPVITIDFPFSGWSAEKVITVSGSVQNAAEITEVDFYLNGILRTIPVKDERFKQKIVLGAGSNYIKISAANQYGSSSKTVRLVTENSSSDLKVILFWDTDQTDVDLWVTDPNNERVYYAHKRSKIGGTLDIDITNGYGPETFTLPKAAPGEYTVQIQYFGGNRPTMARVVVLLFSGTPREKKYVFPAFLFKSGKGMTIGKFNVQ